MNFKEHILFDIYNLGKPLGIQLMSLPKTIPSILTKEEKYKKIEDFIKDKKKYIILSPGTNLKYKRVDETFVTLTNYLADLNYFIFFIGAKQEKNIYLDILEKVKVNLRDKIFEFYGSLRIKDLAYLMRRSSAVIGIDGGPMHLAASVGAKTIVLFGHEDPRRYKPIGENVTSLFGLPLNKNKYMGSYYKENRLKKISWAQIKEALENINIR